MIRVAGIFASIAAGLFVAQYFAGWTALVAGVIAGYAAYMAFNHWEEQRLLPVLDPPAKTWNIPFALAWGKIRLALLHSGYATSESGAVGWRVMHEDEANGMFSASLNFNERISMSKSEPRTVTLNVSLTPATSDTTTVKLDYHIYSQFGTVTVERVINKTNEIIDKRLLEAGTPVSPLFGAKDGEPVPATAGAGGSELPPNAKKVGF